MSARDRARKREAAQARDASAAIVDARAAIVGGWGHGGKWNARGERVDVGAIGASIPVGVAKQFGGPTARPETEGPLPRHPDDPRDIRDEARRPRMRRPHMTLAHEEPAGAAGPCVSLSVS